MYNLYVYYICNNLFKYMHKDISYIKARIYRPVSCYAITC